MPNSTPFISPVAVEVRSQFLSPCEERLLERRILGVARGPGEKGIFQEGQVAFIIKL